MAAIWRILIVRARPGDPADPHPTRVAQSRRDTYLPEKIPFLGSQGARDDFFHDLVGPAVDARDARIGVHTGYQEFRFGLHRVIA